MRRFLVATGLTLSLVTPAVAQDSWSICDIAPADFASEVLPQLVGSWTASNDQGLAVIGPMTMPIQPEADSLVDVLMRGDDIAMTSWLEPGAPMLEPQLIAGPNQIDTVVAALGAGSTESDLSGVIGCDVQDYPALVTTFTGSEDGAVLTYTSTLRVLGDNLMTGVIYGNISSEDGAMHVYRLVTMSR